MPKRTVSILRLLVALLAEGVDRNTSLPAALEWLNRSPSSRRAWIEMLWCASARPARPVALLAEGVDRNIENISRDASDMRSPSSRRAWIEMSAPRSWPLCGWSPSSRRAWIEMKDI